MSFYTAAITLILVMDPFGNIPLFISVLRKVPRRKRKLIILREMIMALAILTFFLFFGKYILSGMHISEPALSIAGGIILFLIALRMIFPARLIPEEDEEEESPLIVPLAVPLVAGPSSMATVILFSTQAPEQNWLWFLALLTAWAVSAVILVLSDFLSELLGSRVLKAIERLMGMILTTLAVQMLLTGLADYLRLQVFL